MSSYNNNTITNVNKSTSVLKKKKVLTGKELAKHINRMHLQGNKNQKQPKAQRQSTSNVSTIKKQFGGKRRPVSKTIGQQTPMQNSQILRYLKPKQVFEQLTGKLIANSQGSETARFP